LQHAHVRLQSDKAFLFFIENSMYKVMLFYVDVEYPHQVFNKYHVPGQLITTSRLFRIARDRTCEFVDFYFFIFFSSHMMSSGQCVFAFLFGLLTFLPPRGICESMNVTDVAEQIQAENALAKLVKMFSKPGAFKRVSEGRQTRFSKLFRNFYYVFFKFFIAFSIANRKFHLGEIRFSIVAHKIIISAFSQKI